MGIKTLPVVLSLFSPRVLQPARLDRGLGDPEGGIKLINALISAGVELLGRFPPFSLCQPHPFCISQRHTGGGVGVGWNFGVFGGFLSRWQQAGHSAVPRLAGEGGDTTPSSGTRPQALPARFYFISRVKTGAVPVPAWVGHGRAL